MTINAVNGHYPVPGGIRRPAPVPVAGNAGALGRGQARRAPVERIIEGEVLGAADGRRGRHDPFTRARHAGVGAGTSTNHGPGIVAYLAHAVTPRTATAPRYVDCYI